MKNKLKLFWRNLIDWIAIDNYPNQYGTGYFFMMSEVPIQIPNSKIVSAFDYPINSLQNINKYFFNKIFCKF